MKTYSINTLGCKVNQYESQQIRELLEKSGLRDAELSEKPDLIVINTCCVTHTASAKSRQQIRKFQKHHPESIIVVCGCLPVINNNISQPDDDISTDQSAAQAEKTHFITNRDELAATLTQLISSAYPKHYLQADRNCTDGLNLQSINSIKAEFDAKIKLKKGFIENPELPVLTCFKNQTRAFLKVQDGCDGFCTYCIIPKTRPDVRSKPIDEAVEEAKLLVKAGHKEIVITGICLGAYGRETVRRRNNVSDKYDYLAELIEKIAQIKHLERIRLSSIEPSDITENLLEVYQRYDNIMPHLHLSLQSGSDAVLKRMCRRYKIDDVRRKIERIRYVLDKPAITTDIIVGFPGETDKDFDATVNFSQEAGFAKIHVFRFSPREGTPAARMQGAIASKVINARSDQLLELDKTSGYNFREQFLGKNETVLIENEAGRSSGRSERYFMVHIDLPANSGGAFNLKKNDLVKVLLIKNTSNGMTGKPLEVF
jgi:threonylcarbamoyladenosine tRNA methylthiotransferase MtaB